MRITYALLCTALIATVACDDDDDDGVGPRNFSVSAQDAVTVMQDDSVDVSPVLTNENTGEVVAGASLYYESANPAIASVDGIENNSEVRIYGNTPGTTEIYVQFLNYAADTITVTVTERPVGSVVLEIDPEEETPFPFHPGEELQLAATLFDASGAEITRRSATFTSADEDIAEVSSSGVVTAVDAGTVNIIATAGGKADTLAITVTLRPVETVTVIPEQVAIFVGDTAFFEAELVAANEEVLERDVTWTSSNPLIAEVVAPGKVVGRLPGTVTITATVEGKSDSAVLGVAAENP